MTVDFINWLLKLSIEFAILLIQSHLNLSLVIEFVADFFRNNTAVEEFIEAAEHCLYCSDWNWMKYWPIEKVWLEDLIWINESIFNIDKSTSFSFSFELEGDFNKDWIPVLNSPVVNHSLSNSSRYSRNLDFWLQNILISECWMKYWFIIFLLLMYVCCSLFYV